MAETLGSYLNTTDRMDHRVLGILYNNIIGETFYGEDDALAFLEHSPGDGAYDDVPPDYFRRGNTVLSRNDLITAAAEPSTAITDEADGKIASGYGAVIDDLADQGLLRTGSYISTSTNQGSETDHVTFRAERFGTTPFYDMINISAVLSAMDGPDTRVGDTYDLVKREASRETDARWLDPLGVSERLLDSQAADELVAAGVLDKQMVGEKRIWDALRTQGNADTVPGFVPDGPFEAIENLPEDYSGAFYRPSSGWQVDLFEAARDHHDQNI